MTAMCLFDRRYLDLPDPQTLGAEADRNTLGRTMFA